VIMVVLINEQHHCLITCHCHAHWQHLISHHHQSFPWTLSSNIPDSICHIVFVATVLVPCISHKSCILANVTSSWMLEFEL
jgi:hypothetical protein